MQLKEKFPDWKQIRFDETAVVLFLAILYVPLLLQWVHGWVFKSISIEHEYFSHGLLGIPLAVYIAWEKRDKWMKLPDRGSVWGAVLFGVAGVFYLSGLWDLVNLSFPIMLAGLCLWFKGFSGWRLLWFPWLLLFLATPNDIPYLIATYILPLQKFIAATAGFILGLIGLNVNVDQIYLFVGGKTVEVAPHCAGLKMLFTTIYVALILLYWTNNLKSKKISLTFLAAAIAISVGTNIVRNALLTYFHGTGREGMFHWLHASWGGDMMSATMLVLLIPALLIIEKLSDAFTGVPVEGEGA